MSRPPKKGLGYFPLDVDIFDDDKIFELTSEYGPLGEVVYFRILCLIYRNGYYYKFKSLDKLVSLILRSIGNRWCRDRNLILQVIPFLAECNLLSPELMRENVLTSAGIQRRYLNVARRRAVNIVEYNLLGEEGLVVVPENIVSVTETPVIVTETPVIVTETPVIATKRKEKESKGKQRKAEESKGPGAAGPAAAPTALSEHDQLETILALIRDNICPVTAMIRQDISDWLRHMDAACVLYAVQEAARAGAKSTKYVYSVLQRMLDDGMTTPDAMERRKGAKDSRMEFERDATPYDHYFDEEDEP